jgi:hypothetical protein
MAQLALTALRFEDVRQNIVDFLKANGEYTAAFDYKGSNLGYLIDVTTYVTMLINYQLSNTSNNIFLDTTEIRKNAVSLAKSIGYKPERPVSARFSGKLRYYGSNFNVNSRITIPAYSQFYSNAGRIYLNHEQIEIKYTGKSTYLEGDYIVYEGIQKRFNTLGTGQSLQNFVIPSLKVEENSLHVYVVDSASDLTNISTLYEWAYINTFETIIQNNVFFCEESIENAYQPKIIFGNGIIGSIPDITQTIVCSYIETVGSAANNENLAIIPTNNSDYIYTDDLISSFNVSNFDTSYTNVNNLSYGGADSEVLSSIKENAPRFFATTGRAVTKNDYYTFLKNYTFIQSLNVIGGDELILDFDVDQQDVLGNIYITAVPTLPTNFNLAQRIYLSNAEENEVIYDLKQIAIVSTKRFFYKPSYIYLDITPYIRFNTNVSLSKQAAVKTEIYNTLNSYVETNFSALGVPFNAEKLISLSNIKEEVNYTLFDITNYFVFNNEIFDDSDSKFIYLPLIGIRNADTKLIESYVPFVKSNIEIIDEQLGIDTAAVENLLNTNTSFTASAEDIIRYPYIIKQPPSTCALYGTLQHDYLSREMYNVDYIESELFEIDFGINSYDVQHYYPFSVFNNTTITPEVLPLGSNTNTTINLKIIFKKEELDISNRKVIQSYQVGTITANVTASTTDISIAISPAERAILTSLGIATPDNQIPFIYQKNNSGTISISVKFISHELSTVKINGINKIVDFNTTHTNDSEKFKNQLVVKNALKEVAFTFEAKAQGESEIKTDVEFSYPDPTLVGDQQKMGYIDLNINQLKSSIYSLSVLNDTFNSTLHSIGDYFEICGTFLNESFQLSQVSKIVTLASSGNFIKTINGAYYLNFNEFDTIYYTGDATEPFKKISYIADVNAQKSSSLYVNIKQGDIYRITDTSQIGYTTGGVSGLYPPPEGTDLNGQINHSIYARAFPFNDSIIFDGNTTLNDKWKKMNEMTRAQTNMISAVDIRLDASKNLPISVNTFELKYIVTDNTTNAPYTFNRNLTPVGDVSGYYGYDVILYIPNFAVDETDGTWLRLFNTSTSAYGVPKISSLPEYTISSSASYMNLDLYVGSTPTYTDFTTGTVTCARITNIYSTYDSATFIANALSINHNLNFVYGSDKLLATNDVLVYTGMIDSVHQWLVFDYDAAAIIDPLITYMLPFDIRVGNYFGISAAGTFNNSINTTFLVNDYIAYVGYDEDIFTNQGLKIDIWKKYYDSSITPTNDELAAKIDKRYQVVEQAFIPYDVPGAPVIGQVIGISVEGNFDNTSLLKANNKNCYYNDKLIYLGSSAPQGEGWYKLNKYTPYVYNDNVINSIDIIRELGLKTDPYVRFNPSTSYYELIFDDIFHTSTIGTFNYNTGKLQFNTNNIMTGKYNKNDITESSYENAKFMNFFNNYNSTYRFDKIKIVPISKLDQSNIKINDPETDFDTLFNQYVIPSFNAVEIL